MNPSRSRRLALAILGIVVLVVVAGVFFALGADSSGGFHGYMTGPFGHRFGMGGFGMGGFDALWLFWLIVGVLLVLLLVAVLAPSGAPRSVDPNAGTMDRLKELSEMHDRGALTDEEFTAAKHKLLGL